MTYIDLIRCGGGEPQGWPATFDFTRYFQRFFRFATPDHLTAGDLGSAPRPRAASSVAVDYATPEL